MDLQTRIERLERQNRRLTLALLAVGVTGGVALLLGAGADAPRTVEAERFVLRDANGKKRAELYVNNDTNTHLDLLDKNEQQVVTLFEGIDNSMQGSGEGVLYLSQGKNSRGGHQTGISLGGQDASIYIYGPDGGRLPEKRRDYVRLGFVGEKKGGGVALEMQYKGQRHEVKLQ